MLGVRVFGCLGVKVFRCPGVEMSGCMVLAYNTKHLLDTL